MKLTKLTYRPMRQFLFSSACAVLLLAYGPAQAQQPQEGIRLRIDADVQGEKVTIDTFIRSLDDLDLERYMEELGLSNELNQLNIDINSGFRTGHYWDQEAFQEMMDGLKDIDIDIPAIPPIPQILPEHFEELNILLPNKAVLGVYTDKDVQGARIADLTEDGAAQAAGLLEGDIIAGIDQRTIESPANLSEVIGMYAPGDVVTVTYIRNGKTETVRVTLQENKQQWTGMEEFKLEFSDSLFQKEPFIFEMHAPERGFLGVYLEDADKAVRVTGVEDNSAAKEAGLQEGDIILELNDTKVSTYDDVIRFMQDTKPGDKVRVTYSRDGKRKTTDAILKENNNGMYFFRMNGEGEEEGFYKPNIDIMPVMPCPPGSTYSYSSTDGHKQVNVCITAVQGKPGEPSAPAPPAAPHSLMDPSNLQVYSNPSDGTFNIRFQVAEQGDTQISITDLQGKEVFGEVLPNFSGTFERAVTLPQAAKGTYFVKVTQNGYSNTRTVVVQ